MQPGKAPRSQLDFERDIRPRLHKYPDIVRVRVEKADKEGWKALELHDENGKAIAFYFPHPHTLPLFDSYQIAESRAVQDWNETPNYQYPHMSSGDPRWLELVRSVSKKWSDSFPEDIHDNGIAGETGIINNLMGAMHIGGLPAKPGIVPMYSNLHLREEKGLVEPDFDGWEGVLFDSLVHVLCEEIDLVPFQIKYGKSSSAPMFTTSPVYKREEVYAAFRDYEPASALIIKGDFLGATLQFGYNYPSSCVYRLQNTDRFDKESNTSAYRPSWDAAFAVQRIGKPFEMDKKGPVSDLADIMSNKGWGWTDSLKSSFSACRLRTANGLPYKPAVVPGVFFNGMLQAMMRRFGFTFHDTSEETKMEIVKKSAAFGAFDVGSHDLLWAGKCLKRFIYYLEQMGYPKHICAVIESTFCAPRYAPKLGTDESGILVGRLDELNEWGGLPSGHYGTTPLGCMNMAWEYIKAMINHVCFDYKSHYHDLSTAIPMTRSILNGDADMFFKIKSDDCIAGVTKNYAKQMNQVIADVIAGKLELSNTIPLSFEHGSKYLGTLLCKSVTSFFAMPDVGATGPRLLTDEYSTLPWKDLIDPNIDARMSKLERAGRKFPGVGARARLEIIRRNPYIGNKMIDIFSDEFRNVYGLPFEAYVDTLYKQDVINMDLYSNYLATKRSADGLIDFKSIGRDLTADEILFIDDDSRQYSSINIDNIGEDVRALLAAPSVPIDDPELNRIYDLIIPDEYQNKDRLHDA